LKYARTSGSLSPVKANIANPHLERMEEAILALKGDNDPDVRAYFNPPPSHSTCESTTEYFDSDGEPIGDVSSLPV
jgi:hypothetical protein